MEDFSTNDHDAVIEIRAMMRALYNDFQEFKKELRVQREDHEERIRALERWRWITLGGSGLVALVIGWAVNLIK